MAIHWKDKCFAANIRTIPISFFDMKTFEGVVALIEVSGDEEPPSALIQETVSLFPVQVSIPNPVRYKTWVKQREALQLVINPPSERDIHRMSVKSAPQ
jgi:hypothetical protein